MGKRITDIDKEIGLAVRTHRKALGVSQTALAEKLGVSFQQVQKYENGTNRVSVASLVTICRALGINPTDIIGTYFDAPATQSASLAGEVFVLREKLSKIKDMAA